MRYIVAVDDHEYLVEVMDNHHVVVEGVTYEIDFESISGQPVYSLLIDGKSFEGLVYPS